MFYTIDVFLEKTDAYLKIELTRDIMLYKSAVCLHSAVYRPTPGPVIWQTKNAL